MICFGLEVADAVNQTLLDITALSDQEEILIGQELKQKILNQKKKGSHSKWRIDSIFKKIKKEVKRTQLQYEYSIISDKEINAFTVAGGPVFLFTGILDFIKSEDELAFIIAHEIAHNELKHPIKKVQYAVRAGQINPLFGEVVNVAYQVYNQPFQINDEKAADELAVKMLKKAGYSKQGAIQFFERMKLMEEKYKKQGIRGINDFIPSHPNAQERIDAIKRM